jgi:hypothetical protein
MGVRFIAAALRFVLMERIGDIPDVAAALSAHRPRGGIDGEAHLLAMTASTQERVSSRMRGATSRGSAVELRQS